MLFWIDDFGSILAQNLTLNLLLKVLDQSTFNLVLKRVLSFW